MNIAEIKELVKVIDDSNLTTFELEQDGVKLVLKKEAVAAMKVATPVTVAAPVVTAVKEEVKVEENVKEAVKEAPAGKTINSPMVGTFYASSAPDKPAYVKVGDKVKKGQVVCIVEAMKLMNEIESEVDGEIVEILVNNEDMVEYGQPMFVIK
ncbi:MAG: acetyl-CoA carboxylase biotin carboxyl carrier protein [Lachnospiraceae bacterium]|nr:acetyl-CoA carboxylase biotin carboxyl carrier protein [Lachnospiraceae bacterium]